MLRGPAHRPAFAVWVVAALAVLITLGLRGEWGWLTLVVVLTLVSDVWDRLGPQPRAGRVRRRWPWHDD